MQGPFLMSGVSNGNGFWMSPSSMVFVPMNVCPFLPVCSQSATLLFTAPSRCPNHRRAMLQSLSTSYAPSSAS